MNAKALWSLMKAAVRGWKDDYAPSMGAALAYYTVFSIAPLLVIVVAIAALAFGQQDAQAEILAQLRDLLGPEGAAAVETMLVNAQEPKQGIIAGVLGLIALIVGATTVFNELEADLNRIWRVRTATSTGLWKLLRARVLSFGMVLAIGFLLLVSLILSAALSAWARYFSGLFVGWEVVLQVANLAVSIAVITVLFALIYKFLPRTTIEWRDVWVGAAVTAVLFSIGKTLIGLYLGTTSAASSYGAAGSLVILLLWVYYSAQVFLLGAEFTRVYAERHGSREAAGRPGQRPPQPAG